MAQRKPQTNYHATNIQFQIKHEQIKPSNLLKNKTKHFDQTGFSQEMQDWSKIKKYKNLFYHISRQREKKILMSISIVARNIYILILLFKMFIYRKKGLKSKITECFK